jgi:hypothetical protein
MSCRSSIFHNSISSINRASSAAQRKEFLCQRTVSGPQYFLYGALTRTDIADACALVACAAAVVEHAACVSVDEMPYHCRLLRFYHYIPVFTKREKGDNNHADSERR